MENPRLITCREYCFSLLLYYWLYCSCNCKSFKLWWM